jgi:hypothetical protein
MNTIGTLAYFDGFSGMIPCKVIAIRDTHANNAWRGTSSACYIDVKLTAKRGAYKRGEIITSTALHIVPRTHARFPRNGMARILNGYRWETP